MIDFGEHSLPLIRPLTEEEQARWKERQSLFNRIAFLQKCGATQEEIKDLYRMWEEWKTVV